MIKVLKNFHKNRIQKFNLDEIITYKINEQSRYSFLRSNYDQISFLNTPYSTHHHFYSYLLLKNIEHLAFLDILNWATSQVVTTKPLKSLGGYFRWCHHPVYQSSSYIQYNNVSHPSLFTFPMHSEIKKILDDPKHNYSKLFNLNYSQPGRLIDIAEKTGFNNSSNVIKALDFGNFFRLTLKSGVWYNSIDGISFEEDTYYFSSLMNNRSILLDQQVITNEDRWRCIEVLAEVSEGFYKSDIVDFKKFNSTIAQYIEPFQITKKSGLALDKMKILPSLSREDSIIDPFTQTPTEIRSIIFKNVEVQLRHIELIPENYCIAAPIHSCTYIDQIF